MKYYTFLTVPEKIQVPLPYQMNFWEQNFHKQYAM